MVAMVAGVALACASEGPTTVDNSPLAGLNGSQASDSAGTTTPTPPPSTTPTPGFVHGTVRAPSPNAPPHTDTLANSVKIEIEAQTVKQDVEQHQAAAAVEPADATAKS